MKAPIITSSVLLSLLLCCHCPAFSNPVNNALSNKSIILKTGNSKDGKKLLQSLEKKFERVKGYVFSSNLVTYKKGKKIKQSGKFYFKSPNFVRFEVVSGGKKSGSVVVRQPDGKIKGKAGGFLGKFVVSLSPNSNLLKSANGFNILKSDFETLLENALKQLKPGKQCIASVKPFNIAKQGKAQIIEVLNKNKSVEQRILINPKNNLPLKWVLFRNAKVFSETTFSFLKFNNQISNELFFLDKSNLLAKAHAKALHLPGDTLSSLESSQTSLEPEYEPIDTKHIETTKEAISLVRKLCQTLESVNSRANASAKSNLTQEDRRAIFVIATSLELRLDTLTKLGKKLKEFDQLAQPDQTLSIKWSNFISKMRDSIGAILDETETDLVDSKSISRNAIKIEQQTRRLDNIMVSAKSYL